mgnify:FL=1
MAKFAKIINGVIKDVIVADDSDFAASLGYVPFTGGNYAYTDAQARTERDRLLTSSDWIVIQSLEAGIDIDSDWKVYRQELRDMPADSSWPSIGVWPQLGPKESSDDI